MMNKFHEIIGGRKEKLIKEHNFFMEQITATKPHEPFVLQGNSEGNERLQKAFGAIMKKYEEKLAKQHKLHNQALSAQRDRRIPSSMARAVIRNISTTSLRKLPQRLRTFGDKRYSNTLLIYCSKVPIMH